MLWHPLFTLTSPSAPSPPPVVQQPPAISAGSDGLTVIFLDDPIDEADESEVVEIATFLIRMFL